MGLPPDYKVQKSKRRGCLREEKTENLICLLFLIFLIFTGLGKILHKIQMSMYY